MPHPFLLCTSYTVWCHSLSSVLLRSALFGRLQACIISLLFSRVEVSDKDRSESGSSYLRSEKSRSFAFKRLAYIWLPLYWKCLFLKYNFLKLPTTTNDCNTRAISVCSLILSALPILGIWGIIWRWWWWFAMNTVPIRRPINRMYVWWGCSC